MREQAVGDPSLEIGYPRTLDLLMRLGLRATFFVEGWNAVHNPGAVAGVAEGGHEIGLHGWTHENLQALAPDEVRRIVAKGTAAFDRLGLRPTGFRSPGGYRPEGLIEVLRDLNFAYDSSISSDECAMRPSMLDNALVAIPWRWQMIDYWHYFMRPTGPGTPGEMLADMRALIAAAKRSRDLVTFIFHPHVSGVADDKFAAMEALFGELASDAEVNLTTAGELAARTTARLDPRASPRK